MECLHGLKDSVYTLRFQWNKKLFVESRKCCGTEKEHVTSPRTTYGGSILINLAQFIYRITKSGELCLGLFTSAYPDSAQQDAPTASTAKPPDSNEPKRTGILLAHIIATKIEGDTITDDDMALPPRWKEGADMEPHLGHKEFGRTLAVHSLAVLPTYQKRGLGTILMKSYVQRMVEAETADRIAVLTYDKLVPYYDSLGFVNHGKSKVKFGGGNWVDMVRSKTRVHLSTPTDIKLGSRVR